MDAQLHAFGWAQCIDYLRPRDGLPAINCGSHTCKHTKLALYWVSQVVHCGGLFISVLRARAIQQKGFCLHSGIWPLVTCGVTCETPLTLSLVPWLWWKIRSRRLRGSNSCGMIANGLEGHPLHHSGKPAGMAGEAEYPGEGVSECPFWSLGVPGRTFFESKPDHHYVCACPGAQRWPRP